MSSALCPSRRLITSRTAPADRVIASMSFDGDSTVTRYSRSDSMASSESTHPLLPAQRPHTDPVECPTAPRRGPNTPQEPCGVFDRTQVRPKHSTSSAVLEGHQADEDDRDARHLGAVESLAEEGEPDPHRDHRLDTESDHIRRAQATAMHRPGQEP